MFLLSATLLQRAGQHCRKGRPRRPLHSCCLTVSLGSFFVFVCAITVNSLFNLTEAVIRKVKLKMNLNLKSNCYPQLFPDAKF